MSNATIPGGKLVPLADCYVIVPGYGSSGKIELQSLPDISDSKSASYNDAPVMGRSFPLKTFSHSENRAISMTMHFFNVSPEDIQKNMAALRALESAVYPRQDATTGAPFIPPPVCRIKCGKQLADDEICVVLKSYSVKFPTDVAWDEKTYMPYRYDVDTSWDVVYRSEKLPGQDRILKSGS